MSGKGDMFSYFGKREENGSEVLDIDLSAYTKESEPGEYVDKALTHVANLVDVERESIKAAISRLSEMGLSPKSGNLKANKVDVKKSKHVVGSLNTKVVEDAITVYEYTNPHVSSKMVKVAVHYNRATSPTCVASKILVDGDNKRITAATNEDLKSWYYSVNAPVEESASPELAVFDGDKYVEVDVENKDRAIARLKVAGIELLNRAAGEGLDKPFIEICAFDEISRNKVTAVLSRKGEDIDEDKIDIEYLENEEAELEEVEEKLVELYEDASNIVDSLSEALDDGALTKSEELTETKNEIEDNIEKKEARRNALRTSVKNRKAQVEGEAVAEPVAIPEVGPVVAPEPEEETKEVSIDEIVPSDASVVSGDEDNDLPVDHMREDNEVAPAVVVEESTFEVVTPERTGARRSKVNKRKSKAKRRIAYSITTPNDLKEFCDDPQEMNPVLGLLPDGTLESTSGLHENDEYVTIWDQDDVVSWTGSEPIDEAAIKDLIANMKKNAAEDKLTREGKNASKWLSPAQVARICPKCAVDMRKKGIRKVKASLFKKNAKDDERYKTRQDTFWEMTMPDSDKSSKFGGCVRYMMSESGGDHSEESANNICGSMANRKNRKAQLDTFSIGDRVLVKPLSRTGEVVDVKVIEDTRETVYEVDVDGINDLKLVSESALESVATGVGTESEVIESSSLDNFPATINNDSVTLGAVASSRAPSFYRAAKKAAKAAANRKKRLARTQAESVGDYENNYDVRNLGSGLYRPIKTAETIIRDMQYNKYPTYEDAYSNYCSEWPEEPASEVKQVLASLSINLKD